MIPDSRIRRINDRPVRPDGRWVVYWMIAARRLGANCALDRAVDLAEELRTLYLPNDLGEAGRTG